MVVGRILVGREEDRRGERIVTMYDSRSVPDSVDVVGILYNWDVDSMDRYCDVRVVVNGQVDCLVEGPLVYQSQVYVDWLAW